LLKPVLETVLAEIVIAISLLAFGMTLNSFDVCDVASTVAEKEGRS
jgi:hypothetical protein